MISIEEALKIAAQQDIKRTKTKLPLTGARGSYLAEEITSPFDLPSFDNSAMDGFAVSGLTRRYKITGEIQAGDTSVKSLAEGEAVRIFTGAKVPENTTAVVMQEKATVRGAVLEVEGQVKEGMHIRRKGNELSLGETVFSPGHLVSPASVGLIGSLGLKSVTVFKKPEVRIISTGDECVPPGEPKREGQIYESNSYALESAMERFGFECREKTHIEDHLSAVSKGVAEFLQRSDVILISGGISVGDYDFVKQALEENGVQELYYKVFQKPGKPLFFGRKNNSFVFALPGNPASSLTCFYIHVLPFLQRFSGAAKPGLMRMHVPLIHEFEYKADRPVFLKAMAEKQQVTILDRQSSSMIHSMASGNALVFMKGPKKVSKGELVETIFI